MVRIHFTRRRIRGCVCCGCIPIPLFGVAGLAVFTLRRFFRSKRTFVDQRR